MINSMQDISNLVLAGKRDFKDLGEVYTHETENYILFKYLPTCEFKGEWNFLERQSRGLIIDKHTGRIIARPFSKFFNLGQHDAVPEGSKIEYIMEKMDGSLGVVYFDHYADRWTVATNGSFASDQAQTADRMLHKNYPVFTEGVLAEPTFTYMVEIIYPDNRIVVNYGQRRELVLLAIRDNETGNYQTRQQVIAAAELFGFGLPKFYDADSLEELAERAKMLPGNEEGFVVVMTNEFRVKIKGDEYKKIHKLIAEITPRRIWENMVAGTYEMAKSIVPDEFLDEYTQIHDDIMNEVHVLVAELCGYFTSGVTSGILECSQKEYALWVQQAIPKDFQKYLFKAKAAGCLSALDAKSLLEPLVLKDWLKRTKMKVDNNKE